MELKDFEWKRNRPRKWLTSKTVCLAGAALLIGMALSLPVSFAQNSDLEKQKSVVDSMLAANKSNGQLADALYELARKYSDTGDLANAETYLRKSLAIEETLKAKDRRDAMEMTKLALGRVLLQEKKFEESKTLYKQLIQAYQSSGREQALPILYNNIAQVLRVAKEPAAAEQYALEGLKLCDSQTNKSARAALLNALGAICGSDSARLHEGIKYMEESSKLLENDDDEDQYLNSLKTLAVYHKNLGELSQSNKTYELLIQRVSEPPDPKLLMSAHLGLADNCLESGQIQKAREHYKKALDQSKDAEAADAELMQTLNGIGTVEADLEHFNEAQEYHEKALALATKAGNVVEQTHSLIQLGTDMLMRGYPEQALAKLQDAEKKTTKQTDPVLRGEVLTVLGRCYRELGQKEAAIGFYKDAIRSYQSGGRPDLQATALNSLATLYLDERDISKFEELYKQAKEIYSGIKDRHEEARLDYTLAQSKLLQDKYADALPLYQTALSKLEGSGDSGMQAAILRGMGLAYYLNGDFQKSLDSQLQATKASGDSSSLDTQWSNNLGVGKAYKALGKYSDAEPYLRKALAIVEQERSNLTRDSFKTYNLDLRKDCFFELVDLLYHTNKPYEAIEVAERGKARAFLDMLANRKERRLDTAFAPQGSKTTTDSKPVMVASADTGTRAVAVQGRPTEIIEETALSPENATSPTIEEIKETVRKRGSTCVEYMTTRDKLYVWVINPDGNIHMPAPAPLPKTFYPALAEGFRTITKSAKSPEEIKQLGLSRQQYLHQLYDVLIKPIEAVLPKDKNAMVTIVPHGQLFCVPFAALMLKDGSYLVENHTLSYAPAIGVLRATQKIAAGSPSDAHKLLAFGNPITKQIAFLGSLPYAEKEVKEIANLYPQGMATIEVGGEATKRRFVDLVAQSSEVHLATHGLVDEEHPMRSALVLAPTPSDDGLLTVSDIITLKNLKANLVVLSACQTGRGKITGDGVVGLSRAFIIAGTPSVLVSQWNVDDIMTEYQMGKFYNEYLKGTDKALALRDAQLATIAALENRHGEPLSDPNFIRANPRLWAAFQLIGESR